VFGNLDELLFTVFHYFETLISFIEQVKKFQIGIELWIERRITIGNFYFDRLFKLSIIFQQNLPFIGCIVSS